MKPLGTTDPAAVGSYRVLGVLGGGGMGRVYLGESRSGRRVAIKVIRSDLAQDPTFRRRFTREVAAIRTVSPLFTAVVVEADTDAAAPWVATTYIEGPTLGELVGRSGPMAGGAVLTLAAGLADAVTSIHRAGLVHRDIKPSNVIINDLGPHVIDFGIALTVEATNLTTSLLLGTPSYIAPEIIQGGDPSAASDVFSLGSTLVFAASGRHLVNEGTMHAQILRMTMGRFDLASVPKELRPLIVRCLSPRPRDRPTADELARIVLASGVAAPAPGWYARPDAAPPVVVPPLPLTLGGERTISRRTLLFGGGLVGAAAVGTALGIGAALARRPDYQAAIRSVAAKPPPPPPTAPAPRVPGGVLWQGRSGVDPGAATQGRQANAARIIVQGRTLISANAGEIVAVDETGAHGWTHPLPTGVVTLRPWGDAVLATDTRTAWLVSGAGDPLATVAAADLEQVLARAEGQSQPQPEIGAVAIGGDRMYLGLGTALVAYDQTGKQVWRLPRTGSAPVGAPVYASTDWVVTHDVLPSSDGTGPGAPPPQVQLVLRSAGNLRQWSRTYSPVPFKAPSGGPPGGAQPVGGPPPGGGAGPGYDDAWTLVECVIGGGQVVIRDASDVRAYNLSTGTLSWAKTSQTPVTSVVFVGGLVLVGAAQVTAYAVGTGLKRWEVAQSGARMVAAPDGRSVIIATAQGVTALDLDARTLWRTALPASISDASLDRVAVSAHEAYLMVQGRADRTRPLEVDVVAFALD